MIPLYRFNNIVNYYTNIVIISSIKGSGSTTRKESILASARAINKIVYVYEYNLYYMSMDSVITSDKVLNSDIIVVIEDNNSLGIELSQKLPGKNILRVSKTQFSSYSDEYEEALKKFESIKLYTALSLPLDHPDRPYFVKLLRELEPEAKAPEVVEED